MPTGTVLHDRYRIAKELGRGGFGAVYQAWDISLNKSCALKENLEVGEDAKRQFAREATVLAGLTHPNLPRVTDHFSIEGQGQYLVMDFVQGEDLMSLMQRGEQVTQEQATQWILQVSEALSYMHRRKPPVVHRDIKPANIRITPSGRAVLVDFGLVKIYDPSKRTTIGARAITPGYSPPEQYGQGNTDSRTDIYSLGATLYTLLTRQEPLESVQRVVGDTVKPAHVANPEVSKALGLAVGKAMALNPEERFATVDEFIAAIKDSLPISTGTRDAKSQDATVLVSSQPVSIPSASDSAVLTPDQKSMAKRRWPWAIGLLMVVFICALVSVFIMWMVVAGSEPDLEKTVDAQVAATRTSRAKLTATAQPDGSFHDQWTTSQISPDGQWSVFVHMPLDTNNDGRRDRLDYGDVYLARVDGSGLKRLTNTPGINEGSVWWSADGRKIHFVVYLPNSNQLWEMGSDGKNQRLVIHDFIAAANELSAP